MQSLVTIIMNCHNGAQYLRQAIDSIYAQTYQNFEIVFWDNASTDESASIAKSYDHRVKYFYSDVLEPLGAARNKALQQVSGEYLCFLDCDDVYLPNKLQAQVEALQDPTYDLVYSGMLIINENGMVIKRYHVRYKSGNVFPNQLKHYEINMPTVMLRSQLIHDENLTFDTELAFSPDYQLFMHIVAKYKARVMKDYLVKYRRHGNSLSLKTLSVVEKEQKQVLDSLKNKFPVLYQQHTENFSVAYDRLAYARAKYFLSLGDKVRARREVFPLWRQDWRFLGLYVLLCMPNKFFQKLVKRFNLNLPVRPAL